MILQPGTYQLIIERGQTSFVAKLKQDDLVFASNNGASPLEALQRLVAMYDS